MRLRRVCSFRFGCRVYDGASTGGDDYRENIASCNGLPVEIGDRSTSENGNMIGPTAQGVDGSDRAGSRRRLGSDDEDGHQQLRAGGDAVCRA